MSRCEKKVYQAKARSHPNIAYIKYWGNIDDALRLPANGSISMNLGALVTETYLRFSADLEHDSLTVNSQIMEGLALTRVSEFLDILRLMAGVKMHACIESSQNFPHSAGLASSASAFAALALAASTALSLNLTEKDLSRLARRGSGSACRSIPGGFVEWLPGDSDDNSYAQSIAPAHHWDLTDCITIISDEAKPTGSSDGHRIAASSILQEKRITDAPRRLSICRHAILDRDFDALADIIELDSNLMHAVMMTSEPSLFYWEPVSLLVMKTVTVWRRSGVPVFYTLDAGPNVHVITTTDQAQRIASKLSVIPGVQKIMQSQVGGRTTVIS